MFEKKVEMSRYFEVPAQCGNLVIFLPLRFYVKSNFGNIGVSKSAILTVLAPLNLRLEKLQLKT